MKQRSREGSVTIQWRRICIDLRSRDESQPHSFTGPPSLKHSGDQLLLGKAVAANVYEKR